MQRALKFVRYLRDYGWHPVVLTADPRAYSNTNPSQLAEVPDDVTVHRAFGIDAKRTFSIRKRYPGFVAWPDPFSSWWPAAVLAGRRLIREHQPAAIWSTFPVSTTNMVAMHLAKYSKLPWIADLRDPITLDGYPPEAMRFRMARAIEKATMKRAARVVFTAKYTLDSYVERYPDLGEKALIIPNGYDDLNFPDAPPHERAENAPVVLLHSGGLQPKGRHPLTFFKALAALKQQGRIDAQRLQVVFRGCGAEREYSELANELGVDDIVAIKGHVPYNDAIREMMAADALIVFQGSYYNHAVPAKLYEYIYARKPILGVVDKRGETERVLQEVGVSTTADINDADSIAHCLSDLLSSEHAPAGFIADEHQIEHYSRRSQTGQLAKLLDEITA